MSSYSPKPPPAGCVTAEEHERQLVRTAELLEAKSRELLESEARIGMATANQLALAAIKARKEAGALAVARENAAREIWTFTEYSKLKGDAGDRPRLRRRA